MTWQERVKQHLKANRISQAELAHRLEVKRSWVSQWLNYRREPSVSDFGLIAWVLNINADWLLFGNERTPVARPDGK